MSVLSGGAPGLPSSFAVPVSFADGLGRGIGRGLTLGGGGTWFVAWQVGYLQTLAGGGVHLGTADRIVGTSAGSVVAAALTHRRLRLLYFQSKLAERSPELVGTITDLVLPSRPSTPEQEQAFRTYLDAADSRPDTIRAIGEVARTVEAHSGRTVVRDFTALLGRAWPSDVVWMTCVDTESGERCVTTAATGVHGATGAAASSAVPGIFEPQVIDGRTCMDGGVSGSGVHLDLLAGAGRTVVLSLYEDPTLAAMLGDRSGMLTLRHGDLTREIESLEASGTKVFVRSPDHPGMPPEELMDPEHVPEAFRLGVRQAKDDLTTLGKFWNTEPDWLAANWGSYADAHGRPGPG